MSDRIPAELTRHVRLRASEACEYCRLPQESQEATFHIDQVLPRSQGGSTTFANLALACVSCSLHKAARVTAQDPVNGQLVQLYNPRRDEWSEHFSWRKDFHLEGLTSAGQPRSTPCR